MTFRWHSSHWGPFRGRVVDGSLEVQPAPLDHDPSPLLANLPAALRHPTRVTRPMVRRQWLEDGPGPRERGGDFVAVEWDRALDLVAGELERVRSQHGNEAIYGRSYGWSSAGRFHHPQSQIHRFFNVIGGCIGAVGSYSAGCALTFFPHVLGRAGIDTYKWHTWDEIVEHTDLFLAFGGLPHKNNFVASGGIARHRFRSAVERLTRRGCEIVNLSPLRDDFPPELPSEWVPVRPFGDVALLLAMSYVLLEEDLHDRDFLERYTTGAERYLDYVMGRPDGTPKTPSWAAPLCGVRAGTIADLARRAATRPTLVNLTHSLQRSQHGEQPLWAAVSFACLLGKVGLPGQGFAYSLGSMGNAGAPATAVSLPSLPQGVNPVEEFIPVARVADMLLHPGEEYDFNGQRRTYPDIKLVYWAGGNPFHHHQDLFRLRNAFDRLDTVVVQEQFWTATARCADIVLPATMSMERRDLGAGRHDSRLVAMEQLAEPHGQARDDYAIFTGLAERLGCRQEFTEGRTADQWLRVMYDQLAAVLHDRGIPAPTFEKFWSEGGVDIPPRDAESPFAAFRRDPAAHRLTTPSGRIELYSSVVGAFGYADCPGHATWLEAAERVSDQQLREGDLQLLANNPATRLHSQLDMGKTSQDSKVAGREPVRMHPADARTRDIRDGDIVRISTERGACLAGAVLTNDIRQGVVQLSTGAWFQPVEVDGTGTCVHGNPNAVTADVGTSRLTQGCSGQLTRVRVEKFAGPAPAVTVTTAAPASSSG